LQRRRHRDLPRGRRADPCSRPVKDPVTRPARWAKEGARRRGEPVVRARGLMRVATILALCALVAGCGNYRNREPVLLHLKNATRGPDEFSILPTKPLEAPKDFAALPPPTPGGKNLVDPTPDEDAVAAL